MPRTSCLSHALSSKRAIDSPRSRRQLYRRGERHSRTPPLRQAEYPPSAPTTSPNRQGTLPPCLAPRHRAWQRTPTKQLPGRTWTVGARLAMNPVHADHPHNDGDHQTACDQGRSSQLMKLPPRSLAARADRARTAWQTLSMAGQLASEFDADVTGRSLLGRVSLVAATRPSEGGAEEGD